jgi:hypothetical protein
MPFGNPMARAFTASSIRMNAPAMPGVYGIANSREWIFISSSENIQGSLIDHLAEDTYIRDRQPTDITYEVCSAERHATRCERLIREYAPVCNESR